MSAGPASGLPDRVLPTTGGVAVGQMLSVVPLGGAMGLRLTGEVDISTVGLLEMALLEALVPGEDGNVLLDMDEVSFVDVAGARAVARAAARLTGGGRLILHRPPPMLQFVLGFFPNSTARIEVVPR